MKYYLVIPARYQSKRLPGKPLINICGVPMIIRTFRQCKKVIPTNRILVATDDDRIKKICEKEKIKTVMTSKKCLTGTDRIAEVAKKFKANFYLNVQGDEPLCNPNDLKKLLYFSKKFPKEIINGYTEIKKKKIFFLDIYPKSYLEKMEDFFINHEQQFPQPKIKNLLKHIDKYVFIHYHTIVWLFFPH